MVFGIFMMLLLIGIGIYLVINPRDVWFLQHLTDVKGGEPTEYAIFKNRISGIACFVIAFIILICVLEDNGIISKDGSAEKTMMIYVASSQRADYKALSVAKKYQIDEDIVVDTILDDEITLSLNHNFEAIIYDAQKLKVKNAGIGMGKVTLKSGDAVVFIDQNVSDDSKKLYIALGNIPKVDLFVFEKNQKKAEASNVDFFMDQLELSEQRATGATKILTECGCGQITGMEKLDESDKAYSVSFVDEYGAEYQASFDQKGFIGWVKDKNGNFLHAPID